MIRVYGIAASRALRVLWMLEELDVGYEHVKTNFATGDTRSAEFLKLKRMEWIEYMRHVSDWEIKTYLEFF